MFELVKPTVPEVEPMVRELFTRNRSGCCLHIVLDDGNLQDECVRYCIECAEERGHESCALLARCLLLMSKTQRKKLSRLELT